MHLAMLANSPSAQSQIFARAVEVNPTSPIPISNRALLYEQTKQYDLAFADYDKLISLRPDDTYYRERKAALLDKFAPEPEPIILKSRSPSAPVTAPLEVEGEPLQPAPSPAPVPIAAIIAHSTRCETIHQWDVRASSV